MIKQNALPLVSLKSMNIVHFEEITLVNILFEQLDKELDFEILSESLEKLLEHMQEHFLSEEKLMQETRYPAYRLHKSDHDKVLNAGRYAQLQWRNKKDTALLKEYLEDDVVAWLDQHIKAMDTPMADYVSETSSFS